MTGGSRTAKKKTTLYVAPEKVGRPRRFGSPEEMYDAWLLYCQDCDNHVKTVRKHVEGGEDGEGEDKVYTVSAPLTHTIKGFCLHVGLTLSAFDATYREDEDYSEVIELMEMDTEIDARSKFETDELNPKLAPLWMGQHKGYSAKTDTKVVGAMPVVISGEDELRD